MYSRPTARPTYRSSGKKALPDPIHIGHFMVILVITLCKKILMIDTSVKIGVYLIGVMLGSVLCDVVDFPKSFFSNKRNFLNQYFVKQGWGWTFVPLLAFIFMTSFVHTCGNMGLVRRHVSRLGVATFWWYVCTYMMNFVEAFTGACTDPQFTDKRTCIKAEKAWLGFDISGHVFLLIHSLLTISEEVKCFKDWSKVKAVLDQENVKETKKLSGREVSQGQISYQQLTPYIKLVVVFLTLLCLLWEFMLVISTVYRFHTLAEKVTAAFIALGCWFISYQMIYQNKSPWAPVLPGESPLQYTRIQSKRKVF